MVWDFAEGNPLGQSSGSWEVLLRGSERAFASNAFPSVGTPARVSQADAASIPFDGFLISTDPPYYDNVGYSDLSDFFYIWLRRSLRAVYPELLSTMLVPKAEELVANPYRHDGANGARQFFEDSFRNVFAHARESALWGYPITVYYAYKQTEAGDDGTASTGWETLLDGMIRSGWTITGTWPCRTETGSRMIAQGANALASSIVLSLRPRPDDAPTTDRRGLIAALHDELPDALRKLQQGAIAPVDLPQAAIGPGMAVFSRYAKVIEDDGSTMTVRSALARINEILDQVLNEQEGDFDATTRFAIAWYRQHGYTTGEFGAADNLARARNTSVDTMAREGILTSVAGKVTLLSPADLSDDYNVREDARVSVWEALHHLIAALERDGLPGAGAFLGSAQERPDAGIDADLVKELAFLLFSITEKNHWTQDALAFNTVATAWPDIVHASRSAGDSLGEQAAFAFEED
jgi:putative DNA methylase